MIVRRYIPFLIALAMAPFAVNAETLDRLYEYGNAATANATSGAGIPRGADFNGSAGGNYLISAGGTDFWSNSDHGSAIFEDPAANPARTGDFSAVVQVQIGLPGESMPGEWGRTGIMARTDPTDAASAYFASAQKFDGGKQNVLQFRDSRGAGTGRTSDGTQTPLVTGADSNIAPVPVWLGLHRFGSGIYATWAGDVGGSPGRWSVAEARATGSADHQSAIYVGLFHQNHNVNPQTSTALFSGFDVGDFDNTLGDFPLAATINISDSAGKVQGQMWVVSEIGDTDAQAATWTVEKLGEDVFSPGLFAQSILRGNSGQNFNPADFTPQGSGTIANISWAGNANPPPAGLEKYPDVLNLPAANPDHIHKTGCAVDRPRCVSLHLYGRTMNLFYSYDAAVGTRTLIQAAHNETRLGQSEAA